VMPLTFTANDAAVAGLTVPWWVPVIVLGVVSTAIAYTLGISGVARLRPSFASLVAWARCCSRCCQPGYWSAKP